MTITRQITSHMRDFIDDIEYLSNAPKNTLTTYSIALEQLNKWYDNNDIDELNIDVRVAKNYIKELTKSNLKNTTINTKMAVYRKYYNWLVDEEYIKSNPFLSIDRLSTVDNGVKYLNKAEVNLLLDSVQNKIHTNRFRDIAIIKFALSVGCRVGVIHRLNREDLDLKNKVVKFYNKKSKKHQILPLTSGFIRAYRNYESFKKDSEAAFVSTRGNRLSVSAIQRMVKSHLKNATNDESLQHIHTIRHTTFTTLAQNGMDMYVIKDYAGHKSILSSQVYVNASMEQIQSASDVLDEAM